MTKAKRQEKNSRVTRSSKTTPNKFTEKNVSKKSKAIGKVNKVKKVKKPLKVGSSKVKSSKSKSLSETKIGTGRSVKTDSVAKSKSAKQQQGRVSSSSVAPVTRGGGKTLLKRSLSQGDRTKSPCAAVRKRSKVTTPDSVGRSRARRGDQVAYVHVGEGGERDLQEHLRGTGRLKLQVLEEESLPDLDCGDLIHGLDQHGTSRDYVEEGHRCSVRCPVGCQGHLRPNEVVVYSGWKIGERLVSRSRWRGRFVTMEGDEDSEVVTAQLEMGANYRRIGGRSSRRRLEERRNGVLERNSQRRLINQQRFRRTMEEDRDETPIPPLPARLGLDIPQRVRAILDGPPVPLDTAEQHGWNPADRSYNVELKEEDPLVMRRRPVAQSTDCIRAKTGYSQGLHVFEITWPVRQRE